MFCRNGIWNVKKYKICKLARVLIQAVRGAEFVVIALGTTGNKTNCPDVIFHPRPKGLMTDQ